MSIVWLVAALITLGWLSRSLYLVRGAVNANRTARSHLTPYNRTLKTARYHLLVLGDSTMFGSGVKNRVHTMGGQLASLFPMASVETLALNGTRVAGLPHQFKTAQHPLYDLIVIGVGGNDVVFLSNYRQLEHDLRDFLQTLELRTNAIVLMHSVNLGNTGFFLWPISYLFDYRTRKLSELYARVAHDFTHVHYVNFYRPLHHDYYTATTRPRFIADDKFHPSDYASRYFFDEMRREVGLDKDFLK
jgi:lysophospholipase L1-like esterase